MPILHKRMGQDELSVRLAFHTPSVTPSPASLEKEPYSAGGDAGGGDHSLPPKSHDVFCAPHVPSTQPSTVPGGAWVSNSAFTPGGKAISTCSHGPEQLRTRRAFVD